MNSLPSAVRELLACPRCRGALVEVTDRGGDWLICGACRSRYEVRQGIPVLLAERAEPLAE